MGILITSQDLNLRPQRALDIICVLGSLWNLFLDLDLADKMHLVLRSRAIHHFVANRREGLAPRPRSRKSRGELDVHKQV